MSIVELTLRDLQGLHLSERRFASAIIDGKQRIFHEPKEIEVQTEYGLERARPDFFIPDEGNTYPFDSDEFYRNGTFYEVTHESAESFSDHKRKQRRVLEASGYRFVIVDRHEIDATVARALMTVSSRYANARKNEENDTRYNPGNNFNNRGGPSTYEVIKTVKVTPEELRRRGKDRWGKRK